MHDNNELLEVQELVFQHQDVFSFKMLHTWKKTVFHMHTEGQSKLTPRLLTVLLEANAIQSKHLF